MPDRSLDAGICWRVDGAYSAVPLALRMREAELDGDWLQSVVVSEEVECSGG
ncbi:hypothetical protein T12_7474, partial [Trichinella patagoniensis]